jgi:BirA family transcriptional regulator, biotin operon repressor / biotin---[acetyl-CoA-carboxylase] ligase
MVTSLDDWIESDFPVTEKGIGSVLRHYAVADSTNRLARMWASISADPSRLSPVDSIKSSVAPNGAVVLADHQTSGRGRLGRTWESSSGQNLLMTAIIRAKGTLLSDHVARGMLPLATSLAVAATISHFVPGNEVAIKWPNDVLLGGRKCSGILVEANVDDVFLIGIGLNVNESRFSEEVGMLATSLLLHTGHRFDRKNVFQILMEQLNKWIPMVFVENAAAVRTAYVQQMAGLGAPVSLNTGTEPVEGVLVGINTDGGLIVEKNTVQKVYYSGDVSFSNHPLD